MGNALYDICMFEEDCASMMLVRERLVWSFVYMCVGLLAQWAEPLYLVPYFNLIVLLFCRRANYATIIEHYHRKPFPLNANRAVQI